MQLDTPHIELLMSDSFYLQYKEFNACDVLKAYVLERARIL